jgi:hypothetical protein
MADFCRQCSIETWGEDMPDLANLVYPKPHPPTYHVRALCEGCGPCVVNEDGVCQGNCLNPQHNSP